jgi:predicted alpha/beta hydrolase family esterase
MMTLALTNAQSFAMITLGDRGRISSALGGWVESAADHLAWPADSSEAMRNLWAARLDSAVLRADRAVLLLAEGASCLAAAWWSRLSPTNYVERVAGAVLLPDDQPRRREARMLASPERPLPFPSIAVKREALGAWGNSAASWGSETLTLPDDIGVDGDTSVWQHAQSFLSRVSAGIVARDIRAARARAAALAR